MDTRRYSSRSRPRGGRIPHRGRGRGEGHFTRGRGRGEGNFGSGGGQRRPSRGRGRGGRYQSQPNSPFVPGTPLQQRQDHIATPFDDVSQMFPGGRFSGDGDTRPISYRQLAVLEQKQTPQNIIIHLAGSRSGLEERLEGTIDNRTVEMLLKVFGKMAESDGPTESLTHVLQLILEYKFTDKLRTLMLNVKDINKEQTLLHAENMLKLMNCLITVLPNDSCNEVAMNMYFVGSIIKDLGEAPADIREFYDQVNANLEHLKEKQKQKAIQRTSRREELDDLHSQPAPDDFRDIPVFPRISDISGDALLFIRTNLIDKAYENVEHYLDVQFRLLREDFIRPLREGIFEVKYHAAAGGNKRKRFDDVKVYEGATVQFVKPGGPHGIVHRIQFSTENLLGVKWNNTKRLMHGNLLCLSSDQFNEDVLFAVVIDSEPDDLSSGLLTVQFVCETNDSNSEDSEDALSDTDEEEPGAVGALRPLEAVKRKAQGPTVDMTKIYTMVETDAYFEAYRHVLAGLKETEQIPLERYIVHYSEDVHAPRYIRPSVTGMSVRYDFSSIAELGRKIEILEDQDWPTPDELGLDPSQTKAVKLALTKELAIIQGPPGTGKTHVGLVIMKVLLQNKSHWSNPNPRVQSKNHCPILIVCYTNHALDQFLEGIAKFAKDDQTIVRVGGRCKNEATKGYSLRELRNKRRNNKGRGGDRTIRFAVGDLRRGMEQIEEYLKVNLDRLEASLHCIPNLFELQHFMPPHLYMQFNMFVGLQMAVDRHMRRDMQRQMQNEALLAWLGINAFGGITGQASNGGNGSEKPGEMATAEGECVMEKQDEVAEDVLVLRAQRVLDTDITPKKKGKHDKKHEAEMKHLIREMGAVRLADIPDDNDDEVDTMVQNGAVGLWQTQNHQKRKNKKRLKFMIRGTEKMTDWEERCITNIHVLTQEDRWRLYRTWLDRWRQNFRVGSDKQIEAYNKLARRLQELRRQEDAEILQGADVVALTTTGAAKYRDLIYKLNCKIVVVEEAAEVLEAHIITAMPKSTSHLILIGDHRQLKPSPTVYELARKYNLDTSLFERLIKKVEHVTLSRQHRMRPSIADLIRPHIYRNLQDHESVHIRDDITGIEKPVFFLSHKIAEQSVSDGRSKRNQHEADFVIALCKHIIIQGYKPDQVTILTMYTGQLFAFRGKGQGSLPKGVRVTAVDNFQGEENDIILLSLVRSNEELLASKSETWRAIVRNLTENEAIGDSLSLQCKHHPDRRTLVNCAKDFKTVPEGGCGQPCMARLDCGHVCPKPCHPYDHSKYHCTKPCDKIIPCEMNHPCKRKCWQPCLPCPEKVPKEMPKCGHVRPVRCQTPPEEVDCEEEVKVLLLCGHEANIYCYQSESPKLSMCKESCQDLLDCGHLCKGSCYECFQGRLHVPCTKPCGRTLVCGHSCTAFCDSCPPCRNRCRTKCKHSECRRTCGEPCVLCQEKCAWKCPHFECTKKCSEPCDRPPCNLPCSKKLKCKHNCIGLCGEPCPKLCRICDKEKAEELFFGDEDAENARYVQLEDCGHVFTYQSLDTWMNMKEEGNAIKMKECPKCKTTIWRSTRYGSVINDLLNSLNKVKSKIWGEMTDEQETIKLQYQDILKEKMTETCGREMQSIYKQIQEGGLSRNDILLLEEKLDRLQRLKQLRQAVEKLRKNKPERSPARSISSRLPRPGDQSYSVELLSVVEDMTSLLDWIRLWRTKMTEQEKQCWHQETKRIEDVIAFTDIRGKFNSKDSAWIRSNYYRRHSREDFELVFERLKNLLLESIEPYCDTKEEEAQDLFQTIKKMAPGLSSNLGISEEEKEIICKAMDFATKGHWYSCSKGHVYAIGECGGATETSVCPECKEEIGGSSHQLTASNRVATEMDGATRPAYDPENNYIPPELVDDLLL